MVLYPNTSRFDDGDEVDAIEECYIFSEEDYHLMTRKTRNRKQVKWIGVRNLVDENSTDLWANLVGYYVAMIDGEEQTYSFLSGTFFDISYKRWTFPSINTQD